MSKLDPKYETWWSVHCGKGVLCSSVPGQRALIAGKMNSQICQDILQKNLRPSVSIAKAQKRELLHQYNDLNHGSKWFQKKMHVLEIKSKL